MGADLPHALALAPEFHRALAERLPFRRGLSSGLRGLKELIEIGVGGKVPDNGLHRAHMQPEPLCNGRGGELVKEVSTADLKASVNRAGRMLKQQSQWLRASPAPFSVIWDRVTHIV